MSKSSIPQPVVGMWRAEDVVKLREALALSQPELAAMTGIGHSTIAQIETGFTTASYPTRRALQALADRVTPRTSNFTESHVDEIVSRVAALLGDKVLGLTPISVDNVLLTRWGKMTERQRHIAELVASGLTNQAIADKLGISDRTIEHHYRAALAMLGVPNHQSRRVGLTLAYIKIKGGLPDDA